MNEHPLQYAFVGRSYVAGTENMSDEQVRDVAGGVHLPVERFNRCPTCEQWSPCDVRKAEVAPAALDAARCGVCGRPLTPDWLDPPTWTLEAVADKPGTMRPVLNKPIRVDPETGAVCWCTP